MIGEIVAYAASRATSGAVENISRHAAWYAAGALVLLLGCCFAVLAAFWMIEPEFGPINSAAIIAGSCLVLALVLFAIPGLTLALQKKQSLAAAKASDPLTDTIKAVDVEAKEAVDHFGPAKVIASAFMVGMGIANQIRGQRT